MPAVLVPGAWHRASGKASRLLKSNLLALLIRFSWTRRNA